MPYYTNFFWATFFILYDPLEFSTGACPTPSGLEFVKTHHCALPGPQLPGPPVPGPPMPGILKMNCPRFICRDPAARTPHSGSDAGTFKDELSQINLPGPPLPGLLPPFRDL